MPELAVAERSSRFICAAAADCPAPVKSTCPHGSPHEACASTKEIAYCQVTGRLILCRPEEKL